MRRIRLLGETLQFNEDIPSWDYIQGENLVEGGLPSYEEATDPIPSYEDVIQEKYWENKMIIEKSIINLENEMNHYKKLIAKYSQKASSLSKNIKKYKNILNDDDLLNTNTNINQIANEYRNKKRRQNRKKRKNSNNIDFNYLCNSNNIDKRRRL